MKNVLKLIAIGLVGTFIFASCNKGSDFDYEKLQEEQRIKDSIENARVQKHIKDQAPALKAYATANFTNPKLDTTSGIWYDLIAAGDKTTYTYRLTQQGGGLYYVFPEITVEYEGKLLNGTVFEKTEASKPTTLTLNKQIPAWLMAFFPSKISYNNTPVTTGGITEFGLFKGSEIRFITPSPWAYDEKGKKDKDDKVLVPTNSPVIYSIKVADIR